MTVANTDPRITKAKRIGAEAVKKAAELQTQTGVNRSTATRAAYKVKAEGLDAVLAALAPPGAARPRSSVKASASARSGVRPRPKTARAKSKR